ncbi:hypothetical protein KKC32_04635 [Patescibacteria group bacterium]|nr:hypothetical protein [Patescibacteria group bacterium]
MSISISIFLILYLIYLLIFFIFSLFNVWHLQRFGFSGFWPYAITFGYIAATILVLAVTVIFLIPIDWSTPLPFFESLPID